MLARGLVRRCPWCAGRSAFFDGWFAKSPACHTCGLRWRRGDDGFELGAAAISAIIVMGPLVLALGAVTAVTWPDFEIVPLFVVLGVGALTLPVLLYPSSYTVWQAIDIVLRPVTSDDFDTPGRDETAAAG